MTNGNDSAFPETASKLSRRNDGSDYSDIYSKEGLTKLEYFTAMAMMGYAANPYIKRSEIPDGAVSLAKDTIGELNKQP